MLKTRRFQRPGTTIGEYPGIRNTESLSTSDIRTRSWPQCMAPASRLTPLFQFLALPYRFPSATVFGRTFNVAILALSPRIPVRLKEATPIPYTIWSTGRPSASSFHAKHCHYSVSLLLIASFFALPTVQPTPSSPLLSSPCSIFWTCNALITTMDSCLFLIIFSLLRCFCLKVASLDRIMDAQG